MLLPILLAASAAFAGNPECDYEDTRTAQLTGATRLQVEAASGTLRVEGRPGVESVRIEAHLCASSAELLEEMELQTDNAGGTARVLVDTPDDLWNNSYARMDLVIVVPERMPAEIQDGSGETWISGLGDAEVMDGSGELTIESMHGRVRLVDGSGETTIRDVAGAVTIEDGSGSLSLRGVRGAVSIADGSGSIDVEDSGSDVEIDDGSGSISVARVAGSFIVESDGSGGIEHSGVEGRVRIPR